MPSFRLILLALALSADLAVTGSSMERDRPDVTAAHQWMEANFGPHATEVPFSFQYGAQPSSSLLKTWKAERLSSVLDDRRTRHTIVYQDPKTGLELRCVLVEYRDFPTLEWTVFCKNLGAADTPWIDGLHALDVRLKRGTASEFVLHHHAGSWPGGASYSPYETPLPQGRFQRISAYGGRPSNTDMPYFSLQWGDRGVILAVGWPGQWVAEFHRDDQDGLRVRSGQEATHFKLHPGEEIRTPLIAMQFWQGDRIDAQNVWRRWMIEHNLPKPSGNPLRPMLSGQSGYCMNWTYDATETNQKEFIGRFLKIGIKIDSWWMDTGWFGQNWEVDRKRFPQGIRPVSEHAHARGIKTILWFEPERVTPGSAMHKAHPQWCLSASTTDQMLLNLGVPEARAAVTERVHKVLTEEGIDVFRSDFNMDPLDHWRQNDSPDRQGLTENHWVQGYLAYWDELRRRNPGLLIDSCASGGRRNDLETMRRAVPLWKCDYAIEPVGMQCHTYGLAMWIPYFGGAGGQMNPYIFRSNMYPAVTKGAWEDRTPDHDLRDEKQDYGPLLQRFEQWKAISPNYLGDYYPLTPFSRENTAWMAWQFDRPESGEGVVQAFRRQNCTEEIVVLRLRRLKSDAEYTVTNLDENEPRHMTGHDLINSGFTVILKTRPAAAVISYKRR